MTGPYPRKRYVNECRRLLEVLGSSLEGREWIGGDFSIADIAICPWLRAAVNFDEAGELPRWNELRDVPGARAAVLRGVDVPSGDPPQ